MKHLISKLILLWNKICYIFDIMIKKSFINKIILGNTKTRQLSGASIKIARSKDLSLKLYDAIDNNKGSFDIKDDKGETYRIRQLIPSAK